MKTIIKINVQKYNLLTKVKIIYVYLIIINIARQSRYKRDDPKRGDSFKGLSHQIRFAWKLQC
jgi:hypothetical protein